jgi:hypothetical protein
MDGVTVKTPGEWSLLWANHERNGMSWTDIVNGIRGEMHCGEGCTGNDCTCCVEMSAADPCVEPHDMVYRRHNSVAPGPRPVTGMRGICRKCGVEDWKEGE